MRTKMITTAVAAALLAVLMATMPAAVAAPGGYGGGRCYLARRVVRQAQHDAVACRDVGKKLTGKLIAIQRQHKYPHRRRGHRGPIVTRRFLLKTFHTGRRGNAEFSFWVPRTLQPGRVRLEFAMGTRRSWAYIVVKRARH